MLSVRDSGPGMKPSELEQIFRPFFSGGTGKNRDKGTGFGLGLSIALDMVERNHGRIEVESEPGKGSEFRIYLEKAEQ